MANDCLVTKLKGVVNNDNLSRLGILTVKVAAGTGFSVTNLFAFSEDTIITSEGVTINGGYSVIKSSGVSLTYNIGDTSGQIFVPKYKLRQISASDVANVDRMSFNLNELSPCTELRVIDVSDTSKGDLSSLHASKDSIIEVKISAKTKVNTDITGSISNLAGSATLTTLNIVAANVEGNVEDLATSINLSSLIVATLLNGNVVSSDKIVGDVLALCKGLYTNNSGNRTTNLSITTSNKLRFGDFATCIKGGNYTAVFDASGVVIKSGNTAIYTYTASNDTWVANS